MLLKHEKRPSLLRQSFLLSVCGNKNIAALWLISTHLLLFHSGNAKHWLRETFFQAASLVAASEGGEPLAVEG
jgi:hypothetical protein